MYDEDEELVEEDEGAEQEPLDEEAQFIHQEISDCFQVFDQKSTGQIPTRYLDKAFRSLGIFLSEFEIDQLTEKIDKNGFVEFPDFEQHATELIREIEPSLDLKQCFSVLDPEMEGIRTDRFKKWMTTLGDVLTESEAKELCKMGDPANSGTFTYDGVIPTLLS